MMGRVKRTTNQTQGQVVAADSLLPIPRLDLQRLFVASWVIRVYLIGPDRLLSMPLFAGGITFLKVERARMLDALFQAIAEI
jgi:hypothetical protein